MHALLFVFEFLGTTELMVIALVALILFGPRKLPEIGRSLGKSIAEFKRASDDFKRTWEFEVELEQRKTVPEAEAGAVAPSPASAGELAEGGAHPDAGGETVARTPGSWAQDGAADEGGWDVATGHAQTPAPSAAAEGAGVSHADGVKTSPAGEGENKAS
jgi:sec-independent protein translocase protein TatA